MRKSSYLGPDVVVLCPSGLVFLMLATWCSSLSRRERSGMVFLMLGN